MATGVLIIGESASGKSTSGRNLDSKETFWINVANKPLPFKGWKTSYKKLTKETRDGNMTTMSRASEIYKTLEYINAKRPEVKTVIVDDWQYSAAFEYFDRSSEKGYDKFSDIATGIASVAKLPATLRDDLTVIFFTHPEESIDIDGRKRVKAKTVGKMIDNALTLEGLFSIVLYTKTSKNDDGTINYVFRTNTDGTNTCKSPLGMFETLEVENDLNLVIKAIKDFE